MKNRMIMLAVLAMALAALIISPGARAYLEARADASREESRVALAYQSEANRVALAERQATTGARVGGYYLLIAGLTLAGAIGLMMGYHRLVVAPLVRVGRVPIARAALTDPAQSDRAMLFAMQALAELGQNQRAMAAAIGTIGQRLTTNVRVLDAPGATERHGNTPALSGTPPHPVKAPPCLAELAMAGRLRPGQPIVIGYGADNEPKTIKADRLNNIQVAGLPDSGKTNSLCYLAAICVLYGGRLAVVDPHAGDDQSLATALAPLESAYLCAPASDARSALSILRMVAGIGRARKAGTDPSRDPVMVILDEFGAVTRDANPDELAEIYDLLTEASQEYRKYGVGICYAGQLPPKGAKGADLRQSVNTTLCHRLSKDKARMILPADRAGRAESLDRGQVIGYLSDGSSDLLTIPLAGHYDLEVVAGITPQKRERSGFEAGTEADFIPSEPAKPRSPEDQEIYSAFLAGEDVTSIAKARNGGSSSGGEYQKRLKEVNAIIREATRP